MRLDQLKEEDIANDPQYKSWLRIYKKSKDAAEAHPKHSTFLKYYNSQTNEGLADMADVVERDHEVQMARSDLYKIAKYAHLYRISSFMLACVTLSNFHFCVDF